MTHARTTSLGTFQPWKRKATICLAGCDDYTEWTTEVSEAEFAFLQKIAAESQERSISSCQPTMEVKGVTE